MSSTLASVTGATGVIIARYRNVDRLDGNGHQRGYSFQGGAAQAAWNRGKRELGAGYKNALRTPGTWEMVLIAYGDCVPGATNRLTLDRTRRDRFGVPQLKINFAFGAEEHAAIAEAHADALEMMTAAGGRVIAGFDRPGPAGTAIHEMGGARMGDDPHTSALNRWSQAQNVPNLFVTDGAQMSSSACQNPLLTYMALKTRACDHAVIALKAGKI